mmetsp:Transcript_5945/g.8406  ORF Transcript_5945/g.8406 Transcript_5945/m.8406 type:complete len:134 (+) Transcript_5945:495-896(+)
MPEKKIVTVLKCMCSPMALAGTGIALMGTGIIPLDQDVVNVAEPFIGPLNIPVKPFLTFLGVSKIFAIGSLWGYGPLPKSVALGGLTLSASCACIGHFKLSETLKSIAAFSTIISLAIIAMLDNDDENKEKKE